MYYVSRINEKSRTQDPWWGILPHGNQLTKLANFRQKKLGEKIVTNFSLIEKKWCKGDLKFVNFPKVSPNVILFRQTLSVFFENLGNVHSCR